MRHLSFVFAFACLSCAPAPSPTESPAPVSTVHDVHWATLCRDHPTASSYTGRTVRLRLGKGEYTHEGTELRLWLNARDVPPVLLIRLTAPLPAELAGGPLVLVGRCLGPTRDGTWRSPRADFVIHVVEATATSR